jgi:glycerol-1-phosphate dehydrogenase [NAD(P)+]
MLTDLFEQLGEPIGREFASTRSSVVRWLAWGPEAARELARVLKEESRNRQAVALFDARTHAAAGSVCLQALRDEGWFVHECAVPDHNGATPVCDDLTQGRLLAALPAADVLIAIGSGVVNDLTKWLAYERQVPYAVYATAASMNGYAAANVAPSLGGIKSLIRAKAPRAIAADPCVLANAPYELTSAGLGDLIAKPVSTADWWVNHRTVGEPFSRSVAEIINRVEPKYMDHPHALADRQEHALRALFEALVLSGCAMTLQGSSLPASGGEHLISHTLDMLTHVDGVPHDLHGRQVGVATLFVAALYQQMLAVERPCFRPWTAPLDPPFWGPLAQAVETQHRSKSSQVQEVCKRLQGSWDELRTQLRPMLRRPEDIKRVLREAGAAHRVSDIGASRERFISAVLHCGAMRARFTSIDLAWTLGLLPGCAESITEQWLT